MKIGNILYVLFITVSLVLLQACGSGGGNNVSTSDVLVSWNVNKETAVNTTGGGYNVYYSQTSGFNAGDSGVTVVDVPYVSGPSAPTSTTIQLTTGTYYIRVAGYSVLNRPGENDGSLSELSPEILISAP